MIKYEVQQVINNCRGNWPEAIQAVTSLPPETFNKKGQPCPMCGGKDRFRFTDRHGEGAYVCRHCGGGSGIDLCMKSTGMEFPEAINAIGDYLAMIPVEKREIKRRKAVAMASMPTYSKSKEESAGQLLSKCVNKGVGEYMKENSVTKLEFPMLNKSTAVIPFYNKGDMLVNAATVNENGDIRYCGEFTYGSYATFGEDTGRFKYMCVDLIDALIVHEYTGSQVLWIGRMENYHAVFSTFPADERHSIMAACNWVLDEFLEISKLLKDLPMREKLRLNHEQYCDVTTTKMILPPQGRSIQSARKLTRYPYDPEILIKGSEHDYEF